MFGFIDLELFPNSCEVLEIVPHKHYIYPIFKNGSSSLLAAGYNVVDTSKLQSLTNIDIFVRNPHERFLSGVQTYLTKLDNTIDKKTALYFIKNYLYLNRHFCPQLFWLINLQRFTQAKLTIRPLSELNTITSFTKNASIVDEEIKEYFANDSKLLFYNEIDEVLTFNLIGQTVTFNNIMEELKSKYYELYTETFNLPKDLVNVVS